MNLNKIVISKNVFKPTGTSQIMIEAAKKIINPKKKNFRFRMWFRNYWYIYCKIF